MPVRATWRWSGLSSTRECTDANSSRNVCRPETRLLKLPSSDIVLPPGQLYVKIAGDLLRRRQAVVKRGAARPDHEALRHDAWVHALRHAAGRFLHHALLLRGEGEYLG